MMYRIPDPIVKAQDESAHVLIFLFLFFFLAHMPESGYEAMTARVLEF